MINFLVKLDSQNNSSLLTCIYGALNEMDKTMQWDHLRQIRQYNSNPWIVIGDINFILSSSEKEGGNPPAQNGIDVNNDLLFNHGIHSMPFIGNPFTWTNRRN